MKLTAHEKVAAPRDAVWARLTEFDRIEQMASKHAEVTRVSHDPLPAWQAHLEWRGVNRDLTVSVAELTAPETLVMAGKGSGIESEVVLTLTALDAQTTTIDIVVDLHGKSLGGKAIVQGLRLARGTIQDKFQARITSIAHSMSKGLA